MKISLGVVAYNEEMVLERLFQDIVLQDYPHSEIEILLIDSVSTDKTKRLMQKFMEINEDDFYGIHVLDNPKRKQASGWNVAIKSFTSEALLRIDAHASIPSDFVRKNVEVLQSGEMVCGGARPSIILEETNLNRVLLEAESSMFGSSVASYRHQTMFGSGKRSYVKSLFHGAYKREVLDKVKKFDETLGRTEDNEFHYRIRKAGYQICFDTEIVSYQYIRTTFLKMCKQKAGNGFWVGVTLGVCHGCLSLFHFVPLFFVGGIGITTLLAVAGYPNFAFLMWMLYWIVAIVMAIHAIKGEKKCFWQFLLPFLFFFLHISYGFGTLVGVLYIPFFKYKRRGTI